MDAYIIVVSPSANDLAKKTNDQMTKGYIPIGGLVVVGSCYMQSMVLRDD